MSYIINFNTTDQTIPGKVSIIVPEYKLEGPINPSTSALYGGTFGSLTMTTPLTLVGKGVPNYGSLIQQNLIYLLENFAGNNPPVYPTVGQLWYKNDNSTLYVCTGISIDGNGRPQPGGANWEGLLKLTGGTLTDYLTLHADPTTNLHAATKHYVDTKVADSSTHNHDALYVNITGDSMTGFLSLNADPTANLHAATKQYVDSQVANGGLHNHDSLYVNITGDIMTGFLTLHADPTANMHAATKQYVDMQDFNIETTAKNYTDAQLLTKADTTHFHSLSSLTDVDVGLQTDGDVLTWNGTLSKWVPSPVSGSGPGGSNYVYTGSFDSFTGELTLNRVDTTTVVISGISPLSHSHTTPQITHTVITGFPSGILESLYSSSPGFPNIYLSDAITALDVNKANLDSPEFLGNVVIDATSFVVTGNTPVTFDSGVIVTLGQDPIQPLEAATKQYVDSQVADGSLHNHDALYINVTGDTMTGYLTLHANPTANMHAATKEYVDNKTSIQRSLVTSAGQTLFTTPPYIPGSNNLWVFVNGVKAYEGASESYTETSSTSITFTYTVPAGAKVEFLVFGV